MTKEDKELLLKDLSARLPYDTIISVNDGKYREDVKLHPHYIFDWDAERWDAKPYLRTMESMTDEEKMYINELIYDKDNLFLSPIPTWVVNECDIDKYIDFCNSKHLDWRGLISKGLALEAPVDMYNF